MTDIDEKLREILEDKGTYLDRQEMSDDIAQIHKAFADAGYLHGETWLALFKEECSLSEPETPDEYLEAAERASGLGGSDE